MNRTNRWSEFGEGISFVVLTAALAGATLACGAADDGAADDGTEEIVGQVDGEAQGARLSIGFALDSLSREESHLAGEISVLELRIASEDAEIERVADEMTERLERAMIAGAVSRELAELTRRFSERRKSIKTLRAKLADNLRSRDDLGYQIRELKERLNGEAEASRQALSHATEQKSAELAQVLTRMTSEMERAYLYLFAFPELAIELGKV